MRIQPVRDFEAELSMIHAMAIPHDKYKYVPLEHENCRPIHTVPDKDSASDNSPVGSTRAYMTFEMSVMAAKLNRC